MLRWPGRILTSLDVMVVVVKVVSFAVTSPAVDATTLRVSTVGSGLAEWMNSLSPAQIGPSLMLTRKIEPNSAWFFSFLYQAGVIESPTLNYIQSAGSFFEKPQITMTQRHQVSSIRKQPLHT